MKKVMMKTFSILLFFLTFSCLYSQRQMENIDRGVVRVTVGSDNFISWRLLGTDPGNTAFNLYRNGTKVNSSPITGATNYYHKGITGGNYLVRPVIDGKEKESSRNSINIDGAYLSIPLQTPSGYTAGDASVGDLDGDGQYEVVLKWEKNPQDNSKDGTTGQPKLDAYKLDGTFMWRIDLGKNIREGAHYTQFIVYDLDGDGKAEVACKTADGTKDGTGVVIGDASADYRNSSGRILSGPEFLTIFDGKTGKALATTNYIPARGKVSSWGDSYGNRVDRFLAGVGYFDGKRPSLLMCRGYYTRSVLVAWDYRNGVLSHRWTFDSDKGYSSYAGQGNHNLSIGDVDGDGRDEVIYGACAIDDNGTGLYNTKLGHGDAMHFSDIDPDRPGLEVWTCHEPAPSKAGAEFRDARTGQLIFGNPSTGDVGRACALDIDPRYKGYELWTAGGGTGGLYNVDGKKISSSKPACNMGAWWDGDLLREVLDGTKVDKWDYNNSSTSNLLNAASYNCASNNTTKANPCLSADIFGDWREEVIWRTQDSRELRIFTTTIKTDNRIYTLMHDPIYRLGIVWQNVAYNQPPHTGFYLGDGMSAAPVPDIYLVGGSDDNGGNEPVESDPPYAAEKASYGNSTIFESSNSGYEGSGYINFPVNGGYLAFSKASGSGSNVMLKFRYANGSDSSRTGKLIVNGQEQAITFESTGSWTTWAVKKVTAYLDKGYVNTIRLESTGEDLANIDTLDYTLTDTGDNDNNNGNNNDNSSAEATVAYKVTNDWGSGFVGEVVIKNNASTALEDWTLEFAFNGNQSLSDYWNGTFTQTGKNITVTGSAITAGSTQTMGFTANYSGENKAPAVFKLNGVEVTE